MDRALASACRRRPASSRRQRAAARAFFGAGLAILLLSVMAVPALAAGGPTVTAGATVSFTPGDPAVTLDAGLAVSDPESATLTGATIVEVDFIPGDVLNFIAQNGISASFSGGTLTLSGSASVSDYQTALQSITFSSSLPDPTLGGNDPMRAISWTVEDSTSSSPRSRVQSTCTVQR